ncbi:hypothetical protein AwPolaro_06040 [Polaromonas sp.]|nr:hypothetical protein AwPolaro_06040 [Polaromonas sp.]
MSCLLLAGILAIQPDALSPRLSGLWQTIATLAIMGSLAWMSLRGQTWNLFLLLGGVPITLAVLDLPIFNGGWIRNLELAQAAGALSTLAGLLWIFLVLAWRGRASLLASHRRAALATYDPGSGLMQPRVIEDRLPKMLQHAHRQNLEGGVLLLRWLNHEKLSTQTHGTALSRLGEILRRSARDVDTVALHDDDHFMIIVASPVSRTALSGVATKILAGCIRASQELDDPAAFSLHIAVWHGTPDTQTTQQVIAQLKARLSSMHAGTKRPVQFIDSALEPEAVALQDTYRREDLLAKINAIETSHPSLAGDSEHH